MNEFGAPLMPFGNRSFGSERSASGASVSVYVHDFEAMDEMLLGPDFRARASAGQRAVAGSPARAVVASGDPRRAPSAGASLPSVAEILAQRRREQEIRQAEAQDFFERGQAAEEAGKTNVARIYYQMAARRAGGSLKTRILARLDSIQPSATAKVARRK